MESEPVRGLIAEYDRRYPEYAGFTERLAELIPALLAENGVSVHSVNARVKSRSSFGGKVVREGKCYSSLEQITDLTGVRIITYFEQDVARVSEIVEREFTIDIENSTDKRKVLESDRFGYLSVHYVLSLGEARCAQAAYRRFAGLKAEVQIRSILQHSWAEIEHDLGYKSQSSVPDALRRRFARLAGLLELADEEFNKIRSDAAEYREDRPSDRG